MILSNTQTTVNNVNVLQISPPINSVSNSLAEQSTNKTQIFNNNSLNSLDPMERLISMGFCRRDLNQKLLNKYDYNIEKVIEELISRQDNDWASYRH